MGCTNTDIRDNKKLDAYIKKNIADGIQQTKLISCYKSDEYNAIIAARGINDKTSPKQALSVLQEVLAMKTRNIDDLNKSISEKQQGRFTSSIARRQALNYLSTNLHLIYYNALYNNDKLNFKQVYGILRNRFKNIVVNRINQFGDYSERIKNAESNGTLNLELTNIVKEINNNQLTNLFAAYESMSEKDFINDLANTKNVANIFTQKDITYEVVENENDGSFEEDGTMNDDSDETDKSTLSWDHGVGEKSNFTQRVEELIKIHLVSIPVLNSTEPIRYENGRPVWNYNRDNELGVPNYMDAQEIMNVLYTDTDNTNLDRFIASIEKIARTKQHMKGLMYLHNILVNNKNLAYKYKMVFSNPVVPKMKAGINDRGKDFYMQSNKDIDAATVIADMLSRNIKGITEDNINKALNVFKGKNTYTFDDVYKAYIELIPDIKKEELQDFYNSNEDNKYRVLDFFKYYIKAARQVIANKQQLKEDKKAGKEVDGSKIVPDNFYSGFIDFANRYKNYAKVKTSLNHRNVLGKQASDVINSSYLTYIREMLNNPEIGEIYAEQKFAGNDYNYSNILVERTSSTGSLIPGLFRKDNSGKYQLTEYANQLLNIGLFDGLESRENNKASVYKALSRGDYLLASLLSYKTKRKITINKGDYETTVNVADFFLSIPSDAPKNFVASMPTYSIDNLYTIPVIDEINQETENVWNALPINDKAKGTQYGNMGTTLINAETLYNLIYGIPTNIAMTTEGIFKTAIKDETGVITKIRFFVRDGAGTKYEIKGDFYIANGTYYVNNATLVSIFADNAVNNFNIDRSLQVIKDININKARNDNKLYKSLNLEHPIVEALRNIILQEILDAYTEIRRVFVTDSSGNIQLFGGKPKLIDSFDINNIYDHYGKKKGKVYEIKNGKYEMLGNVYHMSELDSDEAVLNKYYNLLGNGKVFDLLYGDKETNVKVVNNQIILSQTQNNAINEAIDEYLHSFLNNEVTSFFAEYEPFIKNFSKKELGEFLINRVIHGINMDTMFNGKSKYYKNIQTVLKRSKQVQAGGTNFGNINLLANSLGYQKVVNNPNNDVITINGKPIIGGNGKPITAHNIFTGVTINNTIKHSDEAVIDRMSKKLNKTNIPDNVKERLLAPFGFIKKDGKTGDPTIVNDAQSYITFDEWVRRIAAAGELNKYSGLIEALTNDVPVEQIDWSKIPNKVQIQKNFYYDLHREEYGKQEVPRQIKNAEFVLIPKLIEGTEFMNIYSMMIKNGIDQINTAETSKAAEHKIINLWDNETGELKLADFAKNVEKSKQYYSYNYLYRQQEVPEHTVDARNKAGIQIFKKIIDNLPNTNIKAKALKERFFNFYSAQIKQSFLDLAAELDLPIDKDGDLILNEKGYVGDISFKVLLQKAKENAIRQNASTVIIEMFDEAIDGLNKYPLYTNNIGTKTENIINSLFNRAITRQTIEGWHAAQLSDFGFNKLTDNRTRGDKKLQYNQIGTAPDRTPIYYAEIRLKRWSKSLYKEIKDENGKVIRKEPIPIEEIPESARTMIGYRIPTEGKQSIMIMKVVELLDDAYGSTVVVPDEWVTQSGSDFDVDSVYAMTKHLYQDKDGNVKESTADYFTQDINGYLRYVNAYIDRAARRDLKNYEGKLNNIIEQIKTDAEAKRNQLNEDYKSAIIKSINNRIADKTNLYNLAKNTKDKTERNELFSIIEAIGKKEENIKVKEYINQVVDRLKQLKDSNVIKENENILDAYYNTYDELKNTFISQKTDISETYKTSSEEIKQAIEDSKQEQLKAAETFAIKYKLKNYNDWLKLPVEEQVDYATRNNIIVQTFIDILNNNAAFEENMGRSHFDDISRNIEYWGKKYDKYNKHNDYNHVNVTKTNYTQETINDKTRNYVFTDNAEAYIHAQRINGYDLRQFPYYPNAPKLNVSAGNEGTNQAVIRTDKNGKISDNSFGIVVKKYQQDSNGKFVAGAGQFQDNDNDFNMFVNLNTNMFNRIEATNKPITFPASMAMGKAALPLRFAEWLKQELETRFGVITTINENTRTGYNGYGLTVTNILNDKKANTISYNTDERGSKGGHDFKTQLEWKESAGSGIEIKAISVNLDTGASIGNVAHAELNTVIPIRYDAADIDVTNAEKAYEDDYNKETGIVNHYKIGWSNNNKNIANELLTPYSSQTTAHILDVMKSGAIHNENTYTFNAFKLLLNVGTDYKTAIGFLYQPAMDVLVREWQLTQSVVNDNSKSPFTSALEIIANGLGINTKYRSVNNIIEDFNKNYGAVVAEKYGSIENPYLYAKYFEQRLDGEMSEQEARIHDFVTLIQFMNINKEADTFGKTLRVLTSDKFGAKQTFFETDKIFRDIQTLIKEENPIMATNKKGEQTTLIEAIYPDIAKGNINKMNIADSVYPTLASMLKYASYTAKIVDAAVFDTNKNNFTDIIYNLGNFTKTGNITKDQYKAYKEYLVHKAYISSKASPALVMPISLDDNGTIITHPSFTGSQPELTKSNEIKRIAGINRTDNAENTFTVENIYKPTNEEINEFAKLTPAQKIIWIKRNITGDKIFDYIEVNAFDERSLSNNSIAEETITVRRGDISENGLYDLFNRVYLHNNRLVRLAAIDIAKYAYVVEGNRFKNSTLSRIVSNLPLDNFTESGMNIGMYLKEAMREYETISSYGVASNELAMGFVRQNYNTFEANETSLDRIFNQTPELMKIIDAPNNYSVIKINISNNNINKELIKNKIIRKGNIPYNVIKIKHHKMSHLYYGKKDGGFVYYYPLNPLASYDVTTIEDSMNAELNTNPSLVDCIYDDKGKVYKTIYDNYNVIYNLDGAADITIDSNDNLSNIIATHDFESYPILIVPNAGITENVATIENTFDGKVYSAIRINDNVKNNYIKHPLVNNNYKELLKNYPNRNASNDFIIINHINKENNVKYSSLEDKDPLSYALKVNNVKIKYNSIVGNKEAKAVMQKLHTAGVNYLNTKSIKDNINVSTSVNETYIKVTADELINTVNNFMEIDGKPISVNDNRVIEAALKNKDIEDRLLTLALQMSAFKDRYKLFMLIDVDSLDDNIKQSIINIQKAVNDITNNTKIIQAKRKYINEFIKKTSTNPNVKEGLQTAFDIYGDTSKPDYWIQDIKFNRNPIIQAFVAEAEAVVQEARMTGKQEAVAFEKRFNKLKAEAAAHGMSINFDKMIKDGRFVTKENQAWHDKKDELYKAYVDAVAKTKNVNSVEALKAYHLYKTFINNTTISKYKTVDDELNLISPTGKINYEKDILTAERILLYGIAGDKESVINKTAENYAKYKDLLNQQRNILSNMVGGVLTDEQEQQMSEIYIKINHLTSKYDENYEPKDIIEQEAADRLKAYIEKVKNLKLLYFDRPVKESFDVQLQHNLDIINKMEVRDPMGNLITPLSVLMMNEDYKKARQWLKHNAIYTLPTDFATTIHHYYNELNDTSRPESVFSSAVRDANARDEYGIIDGNKFTDEQIDKIRNEYLANFNINRETGEPYAGIVRSQKTSDVAYRREFYQKLTGAAPMQDLIEVGQAINKILGKAFDNANRVLHAASDKLTIEDLKQLKLLIDRFNELKEGKGSKSVAKFIEENCNVTYNYDAYNDDKRELIGRSDEYKKLWKEIFEEETTVIENGEVIVKTVPAQMFYSLIEPKDKSAWIDTKRTEAIKYLNEHTVQTKTHYYYEAMARKREELSNEEFKDWYFKNHVYNPYSRTFEPLRIWTHTEYINDGDKVKGNWSPRINQTNLTIKDEYLNKEEDGYIEGTINYKLGSKYKTKEGNYVSTDNSDYTALNKYELKAIELFNEYLKKYAFNHANQQYIKNGYLPSIRQEKGFDTKELFKEAAAFFGFSTNIPYDLSWKDDEFINYNNDTELNNPMLQKAIDNNMTPRREVPLFPADGETVADFLVRKNEIIEENKRIDEENDKLRTSLINNDWLGVMKTYIVAGAKQNAARLIKNKLYIADDALTSSEAYKLNYKNELIRNKQLSDTDEVEYRKTTNEYSSKAMRNFIRRIVFEQYKETSQPKLLKLGNIAQNIAGTKYMMLNVTGGIANVLTGQANIGMERLAREHFNEKDYLVGQNLYMGGISSYLSGMFSETSTSLQDGIIKLASVVDYDRIAELTNKNLRGKLRDLRGLLFSPQAMGEHFMQNSVLLTMMKNHKVITTSNGVAIMSREMYLRDGDKEALFEVISDELKVAYEKFVKDIINDEAKKAQYNMFRRNLIQDFVMEHLDKEQMKQFIAAKKRIREKKAKDFDKEAVDVYSQFELVDGYAVLKADAIITLRDFAKFTEKVKAVNKQIHGVYDKLGSALIENKWWGGMVMQFHKHLYPGFKKRYRTKYYYDEQLEAIEGASYTSLMRFLATPISNVNRSKEEVETLVGIQNYIKSTIDFIGNINLYYSLLPENEQANIRRNLADVIYVGAAIVGAIALTAIAGDDDEIEESIWYNLLMYHADRLASEAFAFNPVGLMSEAEKLWSSPVAFMQSGDDLIKALGFGIQTLIDGGFEAEYETGRYAGENKLKVLIERNIPIWRNINRIIELPENNSYYKLGDNGITFTPVKPIAHWINPDVEIDE